LTIAEFNTGASKSRLIARLAMVGASVDGVKVEADGARAEVDDAGVGL